MKKARKVYTYVIDAMLDSKKAELIEIALKGQELKKGKWRIGATEEQWKEIDNLKLESIQVVVNGYTLTDTETSVLQDMLQGAGATMDGALWNESEASVEERGIQAVSKDLTDLFKAGR